MRTRFAEYYRPTHAQFRKLWTDCLFSFDANVLLDLYRFSLDSRNELLKLMKEQRNRIWISNQAAAEFQKRRLEVVDGVHNSAKEVLTCLAKATQVLEEGCKQHPYLSGKLISSLLEKLKECSGAITSAQKAHPDQTAEDRLGDQIAQVLDGKVGEPFAADRLIDLVRKVDERYVLKIPPGYEDAKNKPGDLARGDALIWFQLMDQARAEQRPLIFVTGDTKEDWWMRHKGRVLMPRPELRREFLENTGQDFYMYSTLNFIEHARKNIATKMPDAVIAEAREMSEQRAKQEREPSVEALETRYFSLRRSLSTLMEQGATTEQLAELRAAVEASRSNYWFALRRGRRPDDLEAHARDEHVSPL
jgi:hypothetical protein